MEIRVLRYFLAVAKEETISGAAELLHISQPTLSRQLMEMEESLGIKLFVRGNRKISLTEEGLFLRTRAQEIVDLVEITQAQLHTSDQILSGDIYIGGGETEAMRIIAKVAHQIMQDHPNIKYHLYSGNGDDVTDKLDKGLLDFGVIIEPADVSKYDFVRLPAEDTWGIIMLKDSPLAEKEYIMPEDLQKLPLIISRQTFVNDVMSKWAGVGFDNLNIVATYNLVYNASLLVEQNTGYALTLDKLVNTSITSKLKFTPLYPKLTANLDVVWKKHQTFSKAAQEFLRRLKIEIDKTPIIIN